MDLTEEQGPIGPVTADGSWAMKEITEVISDLKKDNFNLRLRIFFYEERLQQMCNDSSEEIYKTNIDLKVEVETLKEEMREMHRLSTLAIETSTEMERLREYCSIRITQLEKDLEQSQDEVGKLEAMLEKERMRVLELEEEIQENSLSDAPTRTDPVPPFESPNWYQDLLNLLAERDNYIEQLQASVKSQDAIIDQLRTTGAGQGSGDQPANDPDRQLSSIIDFQALEQDYSREKRKCDRKLKELQDLLERSSAEMAEKDYLLADSEFKLKDQEAIIQKLNHKLQEKDQLLQQASAKASTPNEDEREKDEVAESNEKERDIIGHLRRCLQEQEKELQTLNNLLFSHEDSIHTLETELAKMKELQEALEQSNEDIAEKDFILMENDIKLKELEATIQTLNCRLEEKDQLPQILACSNNNAHLQQEATLQKQLSDLEQASEKAREDMLSVIEEKNREICRLQKCLLEFQSHPPLTLKKLLSHIQDAINRTKGEILCAIEGKENSSNLSLLMQRITELQAKNNQLSCYQDLMNSLSNEMKERDLEVDHTREAFEHLQEAKHQLEERLSQTLQNRDQIISCLEGALTSKTEELEVMNKRLQSQTEESRKSLEQMEQRLVETEAMLAQSHAEKQKTVKELQSAVIKNEQVLKGFESLMKDVDQELHPARENLRQLYETKEALESHITHVLQEKNFIISQLQDEVNKKSQQLEVMVCRLQSQTESSNEELEQLEQALSKTEAILDPTKRNEETQLNDFRLELQKLHDQDDSNRKLVLLELRLKVLEATVAQTTENQISEKKLQSQAEDSNSKLQQLELKPLETKGILAKTKEDEEIQVTGNKLTMKKLYGQTDKSCQKLAPLGQTLKERDTLWEQSTEEKEKQLTDYKFTVEKLLTTISVNNQMFKELKEHHQQVLAEHADELQESERRQEELCSAQTQISARLQEKCTEVAELRDLLSEKEKVTKNVPELALQDEGDTATPKGFNHTSRGPQQNLEHSEAFRTSPRCERCLPVLQRENGSLKERLRASDCLNETLSSQLDLCRVIMTQREKGTANSFTSSSLTVDKSLEDAPHMAAMGQSQGGHPEIEWLRRALSEKSSKVTQLQSECKTLRTEKEGLKDGLSHAEANNRALEHTLTTKEVEIYRLKGEIEAHQKQLFSSHDLVKKLCVLVNGFSPMTKGSVNPSDDPKMTQLLSEIQRIDLSSDKCTTQTQFIEEKTAKCVDEPGIPPKIININYMACGASRHSMGPNPSDTKKRDHERDDELLSHSSQTFSMEGSVSSSLTSSLSELWVQEKNPWASAQEDDYLNIQRLISEGKTLTNSMIHLLQNLLHDSHDESQLKVDKNFIWQLSATITANQHALEEAFRLLKQHGIKNTRQKSDNSLTKDFFWENLMLKNETERLTEERSQNKKMLSEAIKRLRKVNRKKLEKLSA